MSKLIAIVFIAFSLIPCVMRAQCNQSFPYQFCNGAGDVKTLCSSNPCAGPQPPEAGGPWVPERMCPLPNCISLDADFGLISPSNHLGNPHLLVDPSGNDVNVFSSSGGQSDATNALNQWLGFCNGGTEGSCCIQVDEIVFARDVPSGIDIFNTNAWTPQKVNSKSCELSCASMQINVNYTPEWRLNIQSPTNDDWPFSDDPTIGYFDYYNGPVCPSLQSGFSAFSFFQLMEHEIGHFFGLDEADQNGDNGSCAHSGMVMSRGNNTPNLAALDLTDEDKCYFEQLYCPTSGCNSCALSVTKKTDRASSGAAILQLYPNPSHGSLEVMYDVPTAGIISLSIFDLMGHEIQALCSAYVSKGVYLSSVSGLSTGVYFCRFETNGLVQSYRFTVKK